MRVWLTGEPSLDELLADEMMGPVVASAGMSREQLRSSLAELALRLRASGRQNRGARSGDDTRRIAFG